MQEKTNNVVEFPKLVLKNKDVLNLLNGRGFKQLVDKTEVPSKVKYWSFRFTKEITSLATDIEKTRIELLNSFSDKDEKGNPKKDEKNQYVLSPENMISFQAEFNSLMEEENIIPFKKITIDLNSFPPNILSVSDMITIESIIDFQGSFPEDPEEKEE